MMLPPVLISLPFKIMLFVLVDGWKITMFQLGEEFCTMTPSFMITFSGFCRVSGNVDLTRHGAWSRKSVLPCQFFKQ